jgi:hypothetical protein
MSGSYFIRYRIQRIIKEAAFVSVPITPDLLTKDRGIDVEKACKVAVKMGEEPSVQWEADGDPSISMHPLQLPRE